jgi:hypothetical protein
MKELDCDILASDVTWYWRCAKLHGVGTQYNCELSISVGYKYEFLRISSVTIKILKEKMLNQQYSGTVVFKLSSSRTPRDTFPLNFVPPKLLVHN